MRAWPILIPFALLAARASTQDAPTADCHTATVTRPDGQREERRYCRNADGQYVSAGTRSAGVAPLPARAEITYQGNYAATITRPGPPIRRFDVNSIIRSAGTSRQMQGALSATLRFEGNRVTGTISGDGLSRGRVSGTVAQGICRLNVERTTTVYEGQCGRSGFAGRFTQNDDDLKVSAQFEARATSVVDVGDREERQAIAQAEQAARDKAAAEEARQRIANLEARAAAGDVKLMWILGYMYSNGKDVEQDYAKAVRWLSAAAARNYGPAHSDLGDLYRDGNGVEKSDARAFDHYLACANAPDAPDYASSRTWCMHASGVMYYEGIGTIRNTVAGVRWMRACALRKDDKCIEWMNEHGVR